MNTRRTLLLGFGAAMLSPLSACRWNEWDGDYDEDGYNAIRQYRDGRAVFEPRRKRHPTKQTALLGYLLGVSPFPEQSGVRLYNAETLIGCDDRLESLDLLQLLELRQAESAKAAKPAEDYLRNNESFFPMNAAQPRAKTKLHGYANSAYRHVSKVDWLAEYQDLFTAENCMGVIWGAVHHRLPQALSQGSLLTGIGFLYRGRFPGQFFTYRIR